MKWLKILGIVVLFVVVIGVVAISVIAYRLPREVDDQVARLKADGNPVCGADMVPAPVPDRLNGALIYERVFGAMESESKAIDEASDVSSPAKVKADPRLLDKARGVRNRLGTALPLLDEAQSLPECRFDINWTDPPEKWVFPYFSKIRLLARMLSAVSIADAADGNMDDALKSIGRGYRIGDLSANGTNLTGCLVRYACIAITSRSLKCAARYGDISEAQARELFDTIGAIDLRAGYVNALKNERALGLDIFERMRTQGIAPAPGGPLGVGAGVQPSSEADSSGRPPSGASSGAGVGGSRTLRARGPAALLFSADELVYIRYMRVAVDEAGTRYDPTIKPARARDLDIPRYAVMTTILLPVFARSKLKTWEAMSCLAGDQVFLAVLAYKSRYGTYPSDLEEVEEKLGWVLPNDPLANAPFGYRREGKGFVLHCVGRDLKDDGGRTIPSPTTRSEKYPYTNGDGLHSADMIWSR